MAGADFTAQQLRTLRAQRAAHVRWAAVRDRQRETEKARAGQLARFIRQVDPDGLMDERTRLAAAENARRAHMLSMTLASVKAQKKRQAQE